MIKNIKIILIFIVIAVLLGVLYLFHNLFGNNSVILSQITYDEKEEILKVIGLNNKNE